MIIRDLFCPHIVYNDPYEGFLVMNVKNIDVLIWLEGIYAPNTANECINFPKATYPLEVLAMDALSRRNRAL